MRYFLYILLIFSFAFAQKTTVIKKQSDGETKIEVKAEVKDDKVLYTITENGKTEEFEADPEDEAALAKIHEKLESHGIDEKINVKICNKTKTHDCKKKDCDPNKCKYALKGKCKKEVAAWHAKDKDDLTKMKIVKRHKMPKHRIISEGKGGYLGVHIQDLSEQLSDYFKVKDGKGVLVTEVVEDTPAEKAGLKAGDVITKVDDKEIENMYSLTDAIRSYEPEAKATVTVIRNGKKKQLKATIGKNESGYSFNFEDFEDFDKNHEMFIDVMPPDMEKFEHHEFMFDGDNMKEELKEMREELKKMKIQLKKLHEEN